MRRTREERVEHAKRLYLSGAPIKDIAKLTATKAGTVEQWARRYGWRPEKEAIKLAELSDKLPGLAEIDDLRLKGAFALYSAVVDARIEYVKQWVKRRRPSEDGSFLASLGGERYMPPSRNEREAFVEDIKAVNELIADARSEIDSIRSTGESVVPTSQVATDTLVDIPVEPHLRVAQ